MTILSPPVVVLLLVTFCGSVISEDPQKKRTCMDREQGICELEGLYSFCFLNYKTGDYNCDKDGECVAKSDTFRGKKEKGGCFGNGVCCCKSDEPICNYIFTKQHNVTDTQRCMRRLVTQVSSGEPKECTDHYCYTLKFSAASGLTSGYMSGCHTMLRFYLRSEEGSVSTDYLNIKAVSTKTCADVYREEAENLGVEESELNRACADVETTDADNNKLHGKMCCCSSGDMCNEELWPLAAVDGDFAPGIGGGISRATANLGMLALLSLFHV